MAVFCVNSHLAVEGAYGTIGHKQEYSDIPKLMGRLKVNEFDIASLLWKCHTSVCQETKDRVLVLLAMSFCCTEATADIDRKRCERNNTKRHYGKELKIDCSSGWLDMFTGIVRQYIESGFITTIDNHLKLLVLSMSRIGISLRGYLMELGTILEVSTIKFSSCNTLVQVPCSATVGFILTLSRMAWYGLPVKISHAQQLLERYGIEEQRTEEVKSILLRTGAVNSHKEIANGS